MEPSRGPLAGENNRNYRVLRQSATDELCEYHGQPGDVMKTFWKKLVEGSYGVPSYPENSDISDTS